MGVRRTGTPRSALPREGRSEGARRRPAEGGRLVSAIRRSGPYAAVRDAVYRLYERRVEADLPTDVIPRHVGVILDGNRRWARSMGLADVNTGHQRGAQKISELLQWSAEAGVEVVTLWLLSTDNLNRPAGELEPLLEIIENTVRGLAADGWHVKPVGALDLLPDKTARVLKDAAETTSGAPGLIVNVAVGYGGRREIADAVRSLLIEQASRGTSIEELAESLDVEHIAEHLYTRGQPDPDLVIRTSGEQRLSGFMLWQSAHSEFYFCEVHWPDFRKVDFLRAMRSYAARHRRYGT
ncbi:short-chain Z-isoprenyl diphosphate synthase [Actinomadura meyerae]|uniref:Isoprenyl transferase n=1 Tax=Actinomadura meyerae TaxID=240840 RepID=A0A239FZW8_9ACTN|nr:isoprenyl transferase [Actinomadura meyerae]SNS61832.1 short-chain Z-isoprenyl diphosphate synthase [Actinomadura meyerae]